MQTLHNAKQREYPPEWLRDVVDILVSVALLLGATLATLL